MVNNLLKDAKKRIFYFDELRALAILFIILCHTTTIYRPYYYNLSIMSIPSYLNMLGWVGVPLFFMISGALLLNRDYNLKDFFKRRFTRILFPFIFWMIITLTIDYVFLGFSTKQLITVFLGQKRYTWFIWVMIGIYLVMPLINSFIREYGIKGVEYFLAIWFLTIVLNTLGLYPFYRFELSYFAGFIGFPILGYYLANKEFRLSDKTLIVLGALLYFAFLTMNWYCQGHKIFTTKSAYLSIFVVIASAGIFLAFKSISCYSQKNGSSIIARIHNKFKAEPLGKLILSLSICSYGIYFVNSLLFEFIKSWHINTFKMMPVIFISVTLVSWLVIAVLDKIPFLRKFIGT